MNYLYNYISSSSFLYHCRPPPRSQINTLKNAGAEELAEASAASVALAGGSGRQAVIGGRSVEVEAESSGSGGHRRRRKVGLGRSTS